MNQKILVIGSANTDMVIKTKHFPLPGETVLGGRFMMNPGGKGANQAIAAARLGGQITFITKIGQDIFGRQALQQFLKEGVDASFVISDPDNPSGVALITVDEKGENTIVVAPGSNGTLNPADVAKAETVFKEAEIILMQLEIPLVTVQFAANLAAQYGKKVILNPAPAAPLPDDLYRCLAILTPNRSEAEALSGVTITNLATAEQAARKLLEKGIKHVVITLGTEGAFVFDQSIAKLIPVTPVVAVDTTAAGDVFNGALAVALSEGLALDKAVEFANQAAAISVTRMGAQASAPFRKELQGLILK
ncbi:ribokinase [Adhaeribacter pallidiroseus]|uniref:Ribokinase n=1 Tax=Adhaeribacter pallidiroseus TaxID=2072847 RepID=A0A369QHH7_9BACT|nr:ribokinase [Adhaeribacter pallidiroseus]RDC61748.1 Ribokinase [Adhaeribacter pallidiroseus]